MTDGTDDRWHPIRPVHVTPRPADVWWASVPADDATGSNRQLCQNQEHGVYLAIRPLHATAPGCQGNETRRRFWICAECAPPPKDEKSQP